MGSDSRWLAALAVGRAQAPTRLRGREMETDSQERGCVSLHLQARMSQGRDAMQRGSSRSKDSRRRHSLVESEKARWCLFCFAFYPPPLAASTQISLCACFLLPSLIFSHHFSIDKVGCVYEA